MPRIRVLRAITRMNIGGPAIQAALLTARLHAEQFETLLVAGRPGPLEGDMTRLARLDRVRPLTVPTLVRPIAPLQDLRALASLVRIARSFRPHVVHTHMAKAGFVGRIAARLTGRPVILHTFHGSIFRGYFGAAETSLYLNAERLLARATSRVIAITDAQRRELIELRVAPAHKVVEIPLGFDLAPFQTLPTRDTARSTLGLPHGVPIIGLVARLVPIKDVGTFLRSIPIVVREVPEARAVIVGDGPERDRLTALAEELGVAHRCFFLGWTADMPAIYAAIDVLALSSLNEGSPVSVIESMASGVPVVASAVGGVPDLVVDGQTGLLVPPGSADELAAALSHVLRDGSLAAMLGGRGRSVATARFGAGRLVRDIESLYVQLLASR